MCKEFALSTGKCVFVSLNCKLKSYVMLYIMSVRSSCGGNNLVVCLYIDRGRGLFIGMLSMLFGESSYCGVDLWLRQGKVKILFQYF